MKLESFLSELARQVTEDAILTLASANGAQKWDVERRKGGLFFGTNSNQNILFPSEFSRLLASSEAVAVILRTFTDRRDDIADLPIKEIRGYVVRLNVSGVEWVQLLSKDTAEASGVDYRNGKIIPTEKAVIFCDPE